MIPTIAVGIQAETAITRSAVCQGSGMPMTTEAAIRPSRFATSPTTANQRSRGVKTGLLIGGSAMSPQFGPTPPQALPQRARFSTSAIERI